MEKYSDCMLIYKISENKPYGEINKKNYDKMKKALNAAGFFLDVENGVLKLQISQYGYERKQKRNAGRKKKCALKKENGEYGLYRYYDVVYMMQTMMDKEISNKIEMPIATFYRHKQRLKESYYYRSLDLNRLKDKEYLDGVDNNFVF